jgi:hypothetical protein
MHTKVQWAIQRDGSKCLDCCKQFVWRRYNFCSPWKERQQASPKRRWLYQSTRHQIPEALNPHEHSCENPTPRTLWIFGFPYDTETPLLDVCMASVVSTSVCVCVCVCVLSLSACVSFDHSLLIDFLRLLSTALLTIKP